MEEVKRSVYGPFISSGYEILVGNTGFYNGTENIMAGTVSNNYFPVVGSNNSNLDLSA